MPPDPTAGIYAREFDLLGRYVKLGVAQGRVLSVEFPETVADAATEHDLLDRIEAYLAGEPEEFGNVAVAMTMPTDQRAVLTAVREMPYGESATVEQLARMVPDRDADEEADLAAVRDALGANPAPLLIPTHRVLGAPDGTPRSVAETLRSVEGI